MIEEKKCVRCGWQPITEFDPGKQPGTLQCWCRKCATDHGESKRLKHFASKAEMDEFDAAVLAYVQANPGCTSRQAATELGRQQNLTKGAMQILKKRGEIYASRDRLTNLQYYPKSERSVVDVYLTRHTVLPDALSQYINQDHEAPVRSPERPTRRQFGIQSSFSRY